MYQGETNDGRMGRTVNDIRSVDHGGHSLWRNGGETFFSFVVKRILYTEPLARVWSSPIWKLPIINVRIWVQYKTSLICLFILIICLPEINYFLPASLSWPLSKHDRRGIPLCRVIHSGSTFGMRRAITTHCSVAVMICHFFFSAKLVVFVAPDTAKN